MRSASIVGAAEAARVLCDEHRYDGVEDMIDGVLKRADEPGEFLAYWRSIAGRSQPKRYRVVQRGVARAVVRLYTERNWLKWDSSKRVLRFADVIELVHPAPVDSRQSDLFKHIIDKRHNRPDIRIPDSLEMIRANALWREEAAGALGGPKSSLNDLVHPDALKSTGLTWEDALSVLGGVVDKRLLWAALIPNMGLMAQVRNLRNFDQAGVSDDKVSHVVRALSSHDAVRGSRMFPFRFLAAYRNAPSLRWSYPLEKALNFSVDNIPELGGRTLILVDRSGSMQSPMSGRSDLSRADAASVFGAALALRSKSADLVQFGTGSEKVKFAEGDSVLRVLDRFGWMGGTQTVGAAKKYFSGHDRVVILTDGQSHDGDPSEVIPKNVPLYTWDLAGYGVGATGGVPNRHVFGGLADSSFQAIPLLERGRNAKWPWV